MECCGVPRYSRSCGALNSSLARQELSTSVMHKRNPKNNAQSDAEAQTHTSDAQAHQKLQRKKRRSSLRRPLAIIRDIAGRKARTPSAYCYKFVKLDQRVLRELRSKRQTPSSFSLPSASVARSRAASTVSAAASATAMRRPAFVTGLPKMRSCVSGSASASAAPSSR
ncbi:hypothetical protein COLU111180_03955 [Cohnella lubricantis]